METHNDPIDLFSQSGCLTEEALRLFVLGHLSDDEMVQVSKHLASCEFCTMAMEGIRLFIAEKGGSAYSNTLQNLRIDLEEKIVPLHPEVSIKLSSSKTRVIWTILSVAATIAMFIGIYVVIKMYVPDKNQLAMIKSPVTINDNYAVKLLPPPAAEPYGINEADPWRVRKFIPAGHITDSATQAGGFSPDDFKYRNKIILTDEDFKLEERQIQRGVLKDAVNPKTVTKSLQKTNNNIQSYSNSPQTVVQTLESKTIQHYRSKNAPSGNVDLASKQMEVPVKKGEEETPIFTVVEEMPSYPGGESARLKFLQDNIHFPAKAREADIDGTVFVSFVVDPTGKLDSIKVIRGIGGGCDEEALRVINLMPRWIPGKQAGKPVRVQFTMPIKFSQY